MNTAHVEGIVGRLTPAQRRALLSDRCQLGTLNVLRTLGLCETAEVCEPVGPHGDRFKPIWSALGLIVKAQVVEDSARLA